MMVLVLQLYLVVQILQHSNYDPLANTDDGSCIAVVLGCTDPTALTMTH